MIISKYKTEESMTYSSFLEDKNPLDVQLRIKKDGAEFGNKAANLRELEQFCASISSQSIRVQIPEICPLSHDFIQGHLNQHAPQWNHLWELFVKEQGKSTTLEPKALNHLQQLQSLIKKTFIDHPIDKELTDFAKLMEDKQVNLMVRSTGKEDDVTAANPGGNESVAAVQPNIHSISQAIGVVIASYFSEKSLKQRLLSPPPANDITQPPFMPVLLQRMIGEAVHAESVEKKENNNDIVCSGVIYTNAGRITIQSAPGHGELIVNSKAPFDTFFISQGDVVYPTVYQKRYRLAPVEEEKERKLTFVENPSQIQNTASIPTHKALEIAKLGRLIEQHYGMPMDVEFVYNPTEEMIYLVQARPIPQGDRGQLLPSSFPPDKMLEIKKDKSIDIIKGSVISPADHAAKVITKKEELLICDNIEEALYQYLAQTNSKVKAVIVKNMAPSTSHEAAQFNAKAIPVLQVEDTNKIEEALQIDNRVLIIDPQRNQIVNWTDKIKNYALAEEELYREKILERGRFRSPLPPEVTLVSQFPFKEKIQEEFKNAFFNEKDDKKEEKINVIWEQRAPYTELQNQLEVLEAAKIGEENQAAIKALLSIQFYIYRISAKKQHDPLFQHAIIFSADVKKYLDYYSRLDKNSPHSEKIREEWLDLVSKLSALVVNPGKSLLISDSIHQRAQKLKEEAYAKDCLKPYEQKDEPLDLRQFAYFKEFIQFKKMILSPMLQEKWTQFVLTCCKNNDYLKRLKQLVKFMQNNNIESDVLNIIFLECAEKNHDPKSILVALGQECSFTKIQLDKMKLDRKKALIQSWERRCGEWSKPDEFDKLYKVYIKEISTLIQELDIEAKSTRLTKKAVLKTVQDLAEMMDKTIKSMKGSPEYQTDLQRQLQVKRFSQLLQPYYQLMRKWMISIDASQYNAWERHVFFGYRLGKDRILNAIQTKFDSLKHKQDVRQLNSSGNFSVASARLGSAASFKRQFIDKSITLEDMFTLIHQNILASTSCLAKDTQLKPDQLPREIQPLIQAISNVAVKGNQADLLNIDHHYPFLRLEFNLPLRNHAAKFLLEYDQVKHKVLLKINFFGYNADGHMSEICDLAIREGQLLCGLGMQVKQTPSYNMASSSLEFRWECDASAIEKVAPIIEGALTKYAKMTFGGEDFNQPFSYLDEKTRYRLLVPVGEYFSKKIKEAKNENGEINRNFEKVMQHFHSMDCSLTAKEHLIISNLFMDQLLFFMKNIKNNWGEENSQIANKMIHYALTHAHVAKDQVQIKNVMDKYKELKKEIYKANNEAEKQVLLFKQKFINRCIYNKIINGDKSRFFFKTTQESAKAWDEIRLAEKGDKKYIDVLSTILKR